MVRTLERLDPADYAALYYTRTQKNEQYYRWNMPKELAVIGDDIYTAVWDGVRPMYSITHGIVLPDWEDGNV